MKFAPKRSAAMVLILVMALLATACGSNAGKNNADNSTSGAGNTPANTSQEANTGEEPAAAGPVEITVYDKLPAEDANKAFYDEQFAAFEAKYPNVKVNHVQPTSEHEKEQFMTAVAAGEQPDAVKMPYPDMETLIGQGIAADISDLWNGSPDKDNYLPSSLDAATVDGKIYGVPNTMYVTALMYNKKLFSEAGVDAATALKDWTSFAEAAQKLTDPTKGQYGNAILGMDWADWFFEYYVWQAGGDLTEKLPDGKAKLTFTSDAVVQALQYYKDLKFKYKAVQKNVVQSLDDNRNDFQSGKAATTVAASDWFGGFIVNGMPVEDIGFAPMPAGPSGKAPAQVGGNYWVFSPKSTPEQREAAFNYAMFMTSKEVLEAQLQFQKDSGVIPNILSVRSDIDMSRYVEGLPVDVVEGVRNAAKDTHLEYYLKGRLSPYIVKVIQKVLLEEKADINAELKAAQDLAEKEVIGPFNAGTLK